MLRAIGVERDDPLLEDKAREYLADNGIETGEFVSNRGMTLTDRGFEYNGLNMRRRVRFLDKADATIQGIIVARRGDLLPTAHGKPNRNEILRF